LLYISSVPGNYDNPLYSKEVHEKTLFRFTFDHGYISATKRMSKAGYIGCDDSGIPSKKNVLFQRADKRSKFARNYISFRSLPKQAGQNKNEQRK